MNYRTVSTPAPRMTGILPEAKTKTPPTEQAYAIAMAEDAKAVRRRAKANQMIQKKNETIDDDQILDLIKRRPGLTSRELSRYFEVTVHYISGRMQSMCNRGLVRTKWVPREDGCGKVHSFYISPVQVKQKASGKAPTRMAEILNFIADNPGCSTSDLIIEFEIGAKAINNHLMRAKNDGFNILSKQSRRNRPAKHWLQT